MRREADDEDYNALDETYAQFAQGIELNPMGQTGMAHVHPNISLDKTKPRFYD